MQVRIVSTPPGEAPEHIRKAWVGLILPVPDRYRGRCRGKTFGVLSAPKTFFGRFFAMLLGRSSQSEGYVVVGSIAVEILAKHSPEAAAWWLQHVPRVTRPEFLFMFAPDACEEIA
jgi:hypothetical protein